MRLLRVLPITGVMLALVAGCSTGVSGQADPTPSTSVTPTNSGPVVSVPLDVSKLAANPCTGLTAAQLAPYIGAPGGNSGKQTAQGVGVNCNFNPADINMPSAGIVVDPDVGASALDQNGDRVPDIAGYPANHSSLPNSSPQAGDCTTMIAVSGKALIGVAIHDVTSQTWQYYTNTCSVTDRLVEQLVANIKSGS